MNFVIKVICSQESALFVDRSGAVYEQLSFKIWVPFFNACLSAPSHRAPQRDSRNTFKACHLWYDYVDTDGAKMGCFAWTCVKLAVSATNFANRRLYCANYKVCAYFKYFWRLNTFTPIRERLSMVLVIAQAYRCFSFSILFPSSLFPYCSHHIHQLAST